MDGGPLMIAAWPLPNLRPWRLCGIGLLPSAKCSEHGRAACAGVRRFFSCQQYDLNYQGRGDDLQFRPRLIQSVDLVRPPKLSRLLGRTFKA